MQEKETEYSSLNFQWVTPLIEGLPPSPRGGHSATKVGRFILIFGGHYYLGQQSGQSQGFKYLNDLFLLDIDNNKWIQPHTTGIPPTPRYAHGAVLAGPRMIFFGGKGPKNKVLKDIFALDPQTMEWFEGPEGSGSPSARFGHSLNFVEGKKIFIFGGQDGESFFNDVHILHLETMSWTKPEVKGPAPCPRFYHCAVNIKNAILIHGGFFFSDEYYYEEQKFGTRLKNFYLNDMRLLDTEKMLWIRFSVSGTPPKPRFGHTINISGNSLVMFGGWAWDSGNRNEEKDLDQVSYFKILNTNKFCWEDCKFKKKAPGNRYGHSTTTIGQHLLIFGGWEYNRATNEVVILRNVDSANQLII